MKRGLSTVIAIVLIIAILMVAIVIFWISIRALLEEGSEEIVTGVSRVMLNIVDGSVKVNVVDPSGDPAIKLMVSRDVEEGDLTKVRFVKSFAGENEILDNATTIGPLERAIFYVPLGNMDLLETISVAPILKTESGKDNIYPVTDTYEFTDAQKFRFFCKRINGWWRFEDNLGDEITPAHNNATGPAGYAKGKYGQGLFYGSTITIPKEASFEDVYLTYSFWFKTSSENEIDLFYQNFHRVSHDYYVRLTTEGKLQFDLEGDTEDFEITSSDTYNDGFWHHVFLILDDNGTPENIYDDKVLLYGDGEEIGGHLEKHDIPHEAPYELWPTSGGEGATIDEVIIWQRALNPAEVETLYNLHLGAFEDYCPSIE